jgi:hypothetical protein
MRSVLFGRPLRAVAFGLGLLVSGQESVPAVKWEPVVISSGVLPTTDLFPAQVLAMAARRGGKPRARSIGDTNGVLGVVATTAKAGASVKVTIRLDGFAEDSTLTATLSEAQQAYELWPTIRFDSRALALLRQSVPATAVFSISVDGVAQPDVTRTLTIRAVNDVPYSFRLKNGRELDTSELFAGFVNENSPIIDPILRRALDFKAVPQFKGYQGTPEQVVREVFAVWNVLQRDGVKYSSIATSSAQSQTVYSQHVRFPDETYRNGQANCVDGTVFFASVLYKLGIYPELVMVPGHMFLGFFTDARRSQQMFLETTRIGISAPLSIQQNSVPFLTRDGALYSESYRLFRLAVEDGNQEYQQARAMLMAKAPRYHVIDIDLSRRAGISPIPRFDK